MVLEIDGIVFDVFDPNCVLKKSEVKANQLNESFSICSVHDSLLCTWQKMTGKFSPTAAPTIAQVEDESFGLQPSSPCFIIVP